MTSLANAEQRLRKFEARCLAVLRLCATLTQRSGTNYEIKKAIIEGLAKSDPSNTCPHDAETVADAGAPSAGEKSPPYWVREPRLAGRHVVRPNNDLLAVLPLDRYSLVSGLVPALIDGEIAKQRLRLES
jgi:hypothetical protein